LNHDIFTVKVRRRGRWVSVRSESWDVGRIEIKQKVMSSNRDRVISTTGLASPSLNRYTSLLTFEWSFSRPPILLILRQIVSAEYDMVTRCTCKGQSLPSTSHKDISTTISCARNQPAIPLQIIRSGRRLHSSVTRPERRTTEKKAT
jgi:hypothetical protein